MVKIFFICCITVFIQSKCCAQEGHTKSIEELQNELIHPTPDSVHANLLLHLALAYVLKPGEIKNDLDSAVLLIKQAENINRRSLHDKAFEGRICYVYSNAYREKGDMAAGNFYIEKSIALYKKIYEYAQLGEAYVEKSYYCNFDTLSERGMKNKVLILGQALTAFEQAGVKERQADVLTDIADNNHELGNVGLASNQLYKALLLFQETKHQALQGVYALLSQNSLDLGNYPEALKYGLLSVQTTEKMQDTSMQLCRVYYSLATAYSAAGYSEEATIYLKKGLAVAVKYKNSVATSFLLLNLTSLLTRDHQYLEALKYLDETCRKVHIADIGDSLSIMAAYNHTYIVMKEYREAKRYIVPMISALNKIGSNNKYDIPDKAPLALSDYFLAIKDYSNAEKYAQEYLDISKVRKFATSAFTSYLQLAKVDSAKGDFSSALANYKLFKRLSDSLTNDKQNFQIAQIKIEYETGKKDDSLKLRQKDIQILQTRNRSQLSDLQKASVTRNIIIITSTLLLIVLYTGYKFKQNSNRKLQVKQKAINQQNEKLVTTVAEKNVLLEEKEWLLKEVHHRVKNNLQIVISLLNTQSRSLENKEAIDAIAESRHRMEAMSLIHQKLYQGESTADVNMEQYIRELSSYLEASYNLNKHISFLFEICEIELDIAQAIPIGLILNETITNAIKYAFVDRDNGNIKIVMHRQLNNDVLLCISDDGIGLPSGFDISKSESMGMRLIRGLVKQIGGALDIFDMNGTQIHISFESDSKLKSILLDGSSVKKEVISA